jgi:hypothetical protein
VCGRREDAQCGGSKTENTEEGDVGVQGRHSCAVMLPERPSGVVVEQRWRSTRSGVRFDAETPWQKSVSVMHTQHQPWRRRLLCDEGPC